MPAITKVTQNTIRKRDPRTGRFLTARNKNRKGRVPANQQTNGGQQSPKIPQGSSQGQISPREDRRSSGTVNSQTNANVALPASAAPRIVTAEHYEQIRKSWYAIRDRKSACDKQILEQQSTNSRLQRKIIELERQVKQLNEDSPDSDELQELREKITEYEEDAEELEELREKVREYEENTEELEELRERVEEYEQDAEELEELREKKEELTQRAAELEALENYAAMFSEWSHAFQDDVQTQWPNRHQSRYTRVKVLLVRWASDDLGVARELAQLRNVFSTYYGYEIQFFHIPDHQASTKLSKRVHDFIGDDTPDTLLIFYYAGHGTLHPERNDAIWAARRSADSPSILSSNIQSLLEDAQSDAIMLHDACCSADTYITKRSPFHGVTELIAACGFDNTAPGPGPHSFTAALCKCLIELYIVNVPFSIPELYSKILAKLRNFGARNITTTPIHCTLTTEKSGRRILLEALPNPEVGSADQSLDTGESKPIFMNVVVGISVKPDYQAWKEWILNAPTDAKYVYLEHPEVWCREFMR